MESWFAPLRSIDPLDEDWSDLEPFGEAVASCDVVLLGEAGHGDGLAFLAKTRIIKYLREVHGYDVLAFEAGVYSCEKAHTALMAGRDPWEALDQGLHAVWLTEELTELVRYVDSTYREGRPLRVTGFDCQFSSMSTIGDVANDLRTWFEAIDPGLIGEQDHALLDSLARSSIPFLPQLGDEHRVEARRVLHRLREVHTLRREEFEAAWGIDTAEVIGRVLLNFDENDDFTWFINRWVADVRRRAEAGADVSDADSEDMFKIVWNIRDRLQAQNLLWHMRSASRDARSSVGWPTATQSMTRSSCDSEGRTCSPV